ncbi:MAG: hypothetical protein HY701_02960 [Gemmatimonadetes bacterium]|nr:hypothetical protein [Gemmatimonadota bacterium]
MMRTRLSLRRQKWLSAIVAVGLFPLFLAATATAQSAGLDVAALERTALEEL